MKPRYNLKIALLTILTVFATKTLAKHFRGGSISWRPVGVKKVEFSYTIGFSYSYGAGCDETKIGEYVNKTLNHGQHPTSTWKCSHGCTSTPDLHPITYYCVAANMKENWEQGQMRFNYTFNDTGPFTAAFDGYAWMALGDSKGRGPWSIATTVDLRSRSDTSMANRSPKTLSQVFHTSVCFDPKPTAMTQTIPPSMQYDCHHELRIPVIDPDGDKFMCHWAVDDECKSVCNGLPGATLDEDTCTLVFDSTSQNAYIINETYGVALTIRDYPKTIITLDGKDTKTPSDSLSSVPLQFLINTPKFTTGCDAKPRFVSPTPAEGAEVFAHAEELLSLVIAADNGNTMKRKIQSMIVMGSLGLQQSDLTPDASCHNTFQKVLTWQTSQMDIGEHIACSTAVNEGGKSSDQRCFTIKIVPDPCANNPCLNGAICQSSKGTLTCQCALGYTGTLCGTDIDDCSNPNLCLNGGTCHDLVNDYICTCVAGYTDKDCSTDIDDCNNPNHCQNGGTCHDLYKDFRCTCVAGYTDKDCSTGIGISVPDIDDCSNPNPCRNGGTCHDLYKDFSCACVVGYTDKDCSTDIDECISDPCLNGGNCTDLVNDFTCTCRPGYTGKNCHYVAGVDFCESKPCANDGICQSSNTGFLCQCVNGWQGKACDYRIHNSKSTKCNKRKASAQDQMMANEACCQAMEYSDCECYISPHVEPEEIDMEQTTRYVLCGLIGFPLGLGLSVLTFLLFQWCASQKYRAKHRSNRRTHNCVDVESPGRRKSYLPYTRPHKTRATSQHPGKIRGAAVAGW